MKNNNENDATWFYIKTLYDKCYDLPPKERADYLRNRCQYDPLLCQEVEALLNMNDGACKTRLKGEPYSYSTAPSDCLENIWIGKDIGPYRILRLIARGGMGAVFLAARHDGAYDKKVAIKLLSQRYVSDPHFIKRFQREQQTLANLDHPNITKLLDGGLTANDVPYIIMEYVEGVRIDRYCRKQALSQKQRLHLFCRVCAAVQYANQNLVVHRDLKPNNILVSPNGIPKLLDFGISKVFDPQDHPSSELTLPAMRFFTPRYASPEQRRGDRMTTLSDVYSLGIILHELLIDSRPMTGHPLSDDCTRTIDNEYNLVRPRSIDKSFPADLETIILKSTSTDPQDRYQSASALAEDIQRFSTNKPIQARPPSRLYQLRKLIARRQWTSVTVAALTICLIGLSAGMTMLYSQANQETRNANEVIDILEGVFTTGYLNWFKPNHANVAVNFRVADTIKYAEDYLNSDAIMNASTRYRLHRLLGKAFFQIQDDTNRAYEHLKIAHELNLQRYNTKDPKIAESLMNLGCVENSPIARVEDFHEAYMIRREAFGEDNIKTLISRIEWGGALIAQGRRELGKPITDEGIAKLENKVGSDSEILSRCFIHLGANYVNGGYRNIGEAALLKALKYSYKMKDKLASVSVLSSLSMNAYAQGKLENAEYYARRSVADIRKIVEKYHPATLLPLWWLGHTLAFEGNIDEAVPVLEEALLIARVAHGNTGNIALRPLQDLAGIQWTKGNYIEAEKHYRELVEIAKQYDNNSHYPFGFRNSLAVVLRDEGKYDESLRYFEQAHRIAVKKYGPYDLRTSRVENNMARLLLRIGELDRAERLILRVIDVREANLTTDIFDLVESKMVHGMILTKMGRLEEAECLLRDAYSARVGLFSANHYQIAEAMIALGNWLIADKHFAQAEKLLDDSLTILQSQFNDNHVLVRLAKQSLASMPSIPILADSNQQLLNPQYTTSGACTRSRGSNAAQ